MTTQIIFNKRQILFCWNYCPIWPWVCDLWPTLLMGGIRCRRFRRLYRPYFDDRFVNSVAVENLQHPNVLEKRGETRMINNLKNCTKTHVLQ